MTERHASVGPRLCFRPLWRRARWTKADDEIGDIELDDDFVQDAVVIELSAEGRAAKQRREALDRWERIRR